MAMSLSGSFHALFHSQQFFVEQEAMHAHLLPFRLANCFIQSMLIFL